MLLAGQVIDREDVREDHLVVRVGRAVHGERLAGLGLRLGADDGLDVAEFEQIAELGGVEDVRRGERALARLSSSSCTVTARDVVAVHRDGDGTVTRENRSRARRTGAARASRAARRGRRAVRSRAC